MRLLPCLTLPACCVVVATEHLAGDFYHVLHYLHVVLLLLQNISLERLEAVCDSLKTNTNLENLEMASVAMTDRVAKVGYQRTCL